MLLELNQSLYKARGSYLNVVPSPLRALPTKVSRPIRAIIETYKCSIIITKVLNGTKELSEAIAQIIVRQIKIRLRHSMRIKKGT